MNQCPVHSWACVCTREWECVCVYVGVKKCASMHLCMCVCDDIKASSSQGFAMCPESFDMSRCIIKTLPHAWFPVPDTTASLTPVVISSLLYSVSPPYLTYVLQPCADTTRWEIYSSFPDLALSGVMGLSACICQSTKQLDDLGMWLFFPFSSCSFFPFFLLWPDGGIQSSSH